jgi:hypothetical protein
MIATTGNAILFGIYAGLSIVLAVWLRSRR